MNKVYIAILLIQFGSFTLYTIYMSNRDRSNAPTWDEIERAYNSGNAKYVGDKTNPQPSNQKLQ
jgi:hypothetical protein